MTSSIANETVDHSKNREPFSFYKFITNKYFLNVVSIVLFLALWDYVAKEKIFRDSLARPLEVVDQLYRLTYMKFAGTNLIGHIWASTQRVLIGFIAASVVAVPLMFIILRDVQYYLKRFYLKRLTISFTTGFTLLLRSMSSG